MISPDSLKLHDTMCLTDSFLLALGHCLNFKLMKYEPASLDRIAADKSYLVKQGLHDTIFLKDSFVFTRGRFVNFQSNEISESISFNRIAADKSYRVKLGLPNTICLIDSFVFTRARGHFVNFLSQQVSIKS